MKIGDKENCIAELRRFFELAKQVKDVATSADLNISKRNPVYFSSIKEEILEEYMTNIYPEKALSKYDKFFGEDEEYNKFKREVL